MQIKEVVSRREMKDFIYLPSKIHKDHKNWVPPIYLDEWEFYNPKKNKSFAHCNTLLLLAYEDNKPVGRIMGIINKKYNEAHNERNARFFALECYNNKKISMSLLQKIEEWALSKGMTAVIGPLGFSDKDPQGFLVEGFDQPVVITTSCNPPYMIDMVTSAGYDKFIELVDYKMTVPEKIPGFFEQIRERTLKRNGIQLINLKSKKEIKPYIIPAFHLVNETFTEIYGFSKVEPGEMEYMANRYMPVLDHKYIKVIVNHKKELIAFILAIPDIAQGIKKAKGKILPTGIIKIMRSQKKTKLLVLMLGAIRKDYRNTGLDALLGVELLKEAQNAGMELMDSHVVLATNYKMRAEYEKIGGQVYKRFNIFKKVLL